MAQANGLSTRILQASRGWSLGFMMNSLLTHLLMLFGEVELSLNNWRMSSRRALERLIQRWKSLIRFRRGI